MFLSTNLKTLQKKVRGVPAGNWKLQRLLPHCWCTTILMLMKPINSNYACLAPSLPRVLLNINVKQLLTATSLHQWNNIINSGAFLNSDWSWGLAKFKVSWMCAFQDTSICFLLDQGDGGFAVLKVCNHHPNSFSWWAKFNQYLYVFLNLSTHRGDSMPLSCRETFVVAWLR